MVGTVHSNGTVQVGPKYQDRGLDRTGPFGLINFFLLLKKKNYLFYFLEKFIQTNNHLK